MRELIESLEILKEETYKKGQLARLSDEEFLKIKIHDADNKSTKWLNFSKEVLDGLSGKFTGRKAKGLSSYISSQLSRLSNEGTMVVEIEDYYGKKTKWLNVDKELISALRWKLKKMSKK